MRKLLIIMILLFSLVTPVSAMEITAPEVPEAGRELFPEEQTTFAQDLWYIIQEAMEQQKPAILKSAGLCAGILAVGMALSIFSDTVKSGCNSIRIAETIIISFLFLSESSVLIRLGTETVQNLSQYGKLFIPVMTGALGAQGAATTSAAIYAGTVLFDSLLTGMISAFLVPLIYIYLVFSIGEAALGDKMLTGLQKNVKWLTTWALKTVIYVFTGYIAITGVVSGTTDATAMKATKLTLSGIVPVVGGILSDASEAVLVSASFLKNAAGIYGLLSFAAMIAGPFVRIGAQYLFLKATAALCGAIASKHTSSLVESFSSAMGLVLGMTGTSCLILMISTVCFMKGVGI